MAKQSFGIVGLGVMGENLALNIESRGFSVAGFDLDGKKVASFSARTQGKRALATRTVEDFVASLESPRRILMMVPAGRPVDAAIASLRPHLQAGDLLIDGGNTYFADTARRIAELAGTGILYIGTGVSGGEEGALHGPAIMPGGNPEAWPLVRPVLRAIAAKAEDGAPCCEWIGGGGAGHFVKMVHNGIEYGDMQMICEAYFLMARLLGLPAEEIGRVFADWNRGELASYLVGITAEILGKRDPETGKPMVDVILDTAEQKGTGKWTSQVALDLGVPAPTIADAVFARTLSAIKKERVAAANVLGGPRLAWSGEKPAFIESIRKALFAAKICSYAQGFQLLRAADQEHHWDLQFGTIASLWRAGCIIRAQFLGKIREAYARAPALANLLLDPYFAEVTTAYQPEWRKVVAVAAEHGIAVPALMSALAYYDGYRTAVLPANLLQAQRDYFGAHTYQRVDRDGKFHTQWTEP
ncbi:MAG: NADP-dependent phosphogluconate dehydrogenase [Deltaproteobacteria bacterium]|nr:NADP-dependent phosphogluconate dehydrogenase [Deltaproteobacteria bacterium]